VIHRGDALQDTERAILDRWDAGEPATEIADAMRMSEKRVLAIVSKFDGDTDWQTPARIASRRLAAACLATGGSFA